jgi:hypothetical protein
MLRKREWQKKIVHSVGTEKNNLHITIPQKKFPAGSKSPPTPQKLNGRPLSFKDAVRTVCKQRLCLHFGIQNIDRRSDCTASLRRF